MTDYWAAFLVAILAIVVTLVLWWQYVPRLMRESYERGRRHARGELDTAWAALEAAAPDGWALGMGRADHGYWAYASTSVPGSEGGWLPYVVSAEKAADPAEAVRWLAHDPRLRMHRRGEAIRARIGGTDLTVNEPIAGYDSGSFDMIEMRGWGGSKSPGA